VWNATDWTSFWLIITPIAPLIFTEGQKVRHLSELRIGGALVLKWSNACEIRNPCWERKWLPYLIPKFDAGSLRPPLKTRVYKVRVYKVAPPPKNSRKNVLNLPATRATVRIESVSEVRSYRLNLKHDSNTSSTLPMMFTGVKSAKFGLNLRTQSFLRLSWKLKLETKQCI